MRLCSWKSEAVVRVKQLESEAVGRNGNVPPDLKALLACVPCISHYCCCTLPYSAVPTLLYLLCCTFLSHTDRAREEQRATHTRRGKTNPALVLVLLTTCTTRLPFPPGRPPCRQFHLARKPTKADLHPDLHRPHGAFLSKHGYHRKP